MSDFDKPKFYDSNFVKGRADYTCDECLSLIPKGVLHLFVHGLWDDEFSTFRNCMLCSEMIDETGVECYCHGQLMDAVDERDGVESVRAFHDRRRENYARRKAEKSVT